MAFFSGYNPLCLDSQKRLSIPARYRDALAQQSDNRLVVTLGVDEKNAYLDLYPMPVWEAKLEKIKAFPKFHPRTIRFNRRVLGHATELSIDKNARLLIPQQLRELVGIDKQAVLSGVGEKFELWDESAWNQAITAAEGEVDFADLPQELRDF